ncbi:GNAT family N-acetyltransferase [Psychromonas ossibalaenae]|uniref:GNAT family N-acetyltransferase n=1 Tax=Psychromonas ossibalaenae TaxID=444922 RepID=UPI0003817A08|nr:GNAT family N-acetyltransferase [Psychromonas ossibalaenae]
MSAVKNVAFDSENKHAIRFIRETVFIKEQGIDAEIEFDGNDQSALHALLFVDGQAAATGRMLEDGHIGRIAVLRDYRGQGLGAKIVLSLIDAAAEQGYQRVYLGAQKQAVDFYTKLGFIPFGEEFMEAGIVHLSMHKILD